MYSKSTTDMAGFIKNYDEEKFYFSDDFDIFEKDEPECKVLDGLEKV